MTTPARADLADVRVADRVFAPHYAAPLPRTVLADAAISAEKDGVEVGRVAVGQSFEVLELSVAHAWGVAQNGVVGYIALSALAAS